MSLIVKLLPRETSFCFSTYCISASRISGRAKRDYYECSSGDLPLQILDCGSPWLVEEIDIQPRHPIVRRQSQGCPLDLESFRKRGLSSTRKSADENESRHRQIPSRGALARRLDNWFPRHLGSSKLSRCGFG